MYNDFDETEMIVTNICAECKHYKTGHLINPCEKNNRFCGYLKQMQCFEEREDEVVEETRTKVCAKCGKTHPVSMFYRSKVTEDGLSALCKLCKPYAGRRVKRKTI